MTTESRQARRTFSPSSGMVSSHEQIRMFRGASAIGLVNLFACAANQGWVPIGTAYTLFPVAAGLASGPSTL
jgi:hypothetical protein